MRTRDRALAAALVLVVGATPARAAETPATVPAERLQHLVTRLGSNVFREREAATRELDDLGEAALESLRLAARAGDPETRRRAAELVERISTRLTTARILAPTVIELNYKDTPLADAVADLAKRTGAPIVLHDPARLRGRTVTVATGPVPLWQAVEQLCRKADLHEWDGFTPLAGAPQPVAQTVQQVPAIGPQGQVVIRSRTVSSGPVGGNQIRLLDGPGPDLPAHHAGAVRVRLLPAGTPFPVTNRGADDIILPLQISAEPKLGWQGALDLRVDRAVDDQGQVLKASSASSALPTGENELMLLANGVLISRPAVRAGPVGVRVTKGARPARRLAELSGSVAAQVRISEPLITLNEPEKAVRQTARGGSDTVFKLTDFTRRGGEVQVAAEVQLPPDVQLAQPALGIAAGLPGGPLPLPPGAVIRPVPGAPAGGPGATYAGGTDCQGLAVEDAQGRRFTVARGQHEITQPSPQGYTCRISALFTPPAKGAEPARLVFTAARQVTIEVPFAVKDVPLP
jgi:hypothetical protein